MSRLVLAAALAAIVALVLAFVPMGGKTVVERWRAAPSATAFAERGWHEIETSWDRLWGTGKATRASSTRQAPARPDPRPARAAAAPKAPEPEEHHTDADRKALDQIVAEHAKDRPAPQR